MAAFNELLSGPSTFSQHQSGFEPILPPPRKRRLSATDPTPSTARQIQPKPAPNGNQNPAFQFAPGSGPKKRGRPSKQEVLARQEAAAARGEVYPAPKTPARKSTGAVTPVASVSFEAGPASEPNLKIGDTIDTPTSAKKRRGRPSKADLEAQNVGLFCLPLS